MAPTRVLVVGIGGASCSGKTLLAKHLARLLPNAILLHQDDFAPSLENIPVHPVHGVKDWDAPPTCVEWPRMRAALAHVREHGGLPDGYASFDHLNKQVEVGVDGDEAAWKERLARLGGTGGEEVLWVLVDGFVLYWDAVVASMLDVKLLLRVHRQTLKARREARATYIIQNAEDAAAGGVWEDPPEYFDNIVYPAYVSAHAGVFEGGDVDGTIDPASGVTLIEPREGEAGMTRAVWEACQALEEAVGEGRGAVVRA